MILHPLRRAANKGKSREELTLDSFLLVLPSQTRFGKIASPMA
jgi:hypothetical protein